MTYDRADEDVFKVYNKNNVLKKFCSNNGLYYHDTTKQKINLLNIVAENMIGFQETKIKKTRESRDIYSVLCYP